MIYLFNDILITVAEPHITPDIQGVRISRLNIHIIFTSQYRMTFSLSMIFAAKGNHPRTKLPSPSLEASRIYSLLPYTYCFRC